MKFEEIEKKVNEYRWLKDIETNYRNMIETMNEEKDYFRIYKIQYATRGDAQIFDVNPHRSIPVEYLLNGMREAVKGIDEELMQLKKELYCLGIEL